MVYVGVDGLTPVLVKRVTTGVTVERSGQSPSNFVDVMPQPLDHIQSGHRPVGLTSGRKAFITIIRTPTIVAHELRVAHKGDDAFDLRLDPWATLTVKRGWGGVDVVDVGVGVGVHCSDPRKTPRTGGDISKPWAKTIFAQLHLTTATIKNQPDLEKYFPPTMTL